LDGDKVAVTVPTRGVKQGCPTSPTLYDLYTNDASHSLQPPHGAAASPAYGAITGSPQLRVTDLYLADDIKLLENRALHLQNLINRLSDYMRQKHLTINAQKTKVLVLHGRPNSCPRFYLGDEQLELVSDARYLGVHFQASGKMGMAAERMLMLFLAAAAKVRGIVARERLHCLPSLILWLFNTIAIPAALYGSQVWSTPFLHTERAQQLKIYKKHLYFMRRLLRVPQSTHSACLLRECAQVPINFYFARCVTRFWNSMLTSDNPFVRQLQAADVALASNYPELKCWTNELCGFLDAQPWGAPFVQAVREQRCFRVPDMELHWKRCDIAQWCAHEHYPADAETLPPAVSRMCVTYQQWFAMPTYSATQWSQPKRAGTDRPRLPPYLQTQLPLSQRFMLSRLRLGAHPLSVNLGRQSGSPYASRVCTLCEQAVQTEKHLILECQAPPMCELRAAYSDLFFPAHTSSLKAFCNNQSPQRVAHFTRDMLTLLVGT
jgi:hypothetical protein